MIQKILMIGYTDQGEKRLAIGFLVCKTDNFITLASVWNHDPEIENKPTFFTDTTTIQREDVFYEEVVRGYGQALRSKS